jgi:hypothetical protein
MHETFDLNIHQLVAAINAFEASRSSAGALVIPTHRPIRARSRWSFWLGRSATIIGGVDTRCYSRRSRLRPTLMRLTNRSSS